jgi:glycosyltransferase involved in cell wall biosynthesis
MAFNEEATLEEATRDVVLALEAFRDREYEVIIVDDGSTDATPQIARRMAEQYPAVRVISHPTNRGPGSALTTGFAESRNEVICFHAADQQLPFSEVAGLIPLLDTYDMVIGYRTDRPGYSSMRLLSSYVYIKLVHVLFGLWQYRDFNFLYLYRREVIDRIAIETEGVFMPTEILVKAAARGARIVPVTVTCLPRQHGTATCGHPNVILKTLEQMLRFWLRWRLGRSGGARRQGSGGGPGNGV